MAVEDGGRGHPLMRRTFFEYKHAFSYSWYKMSQGRINRTHEIRELQNYRSKIREVNIRKKLKVVTYRSNVVA